MPVLKKPEIKEVILPESGAKLKMLSNITYGTMMKMWEIPNTDNNSTLASAAALILEWDFTDEKGVALPINADNLKLLSVKDANHLVEILSKEIGQKKTSKSQ